MKIKHGESRIVFIFRGFVVKLPKIRVIVALKIIKKRNIILRPKLRKIYFWGKYDGSIVNVPRCLFKGIMDNWIEYSFYRKSRSIVLMPTVFSLFGLFNVQKRGEDIVFKESRQRISFWEKISQLTNKEARVDLHMFSSPRNYCKENGRLMLMDYGSRDAREVIEKYGEKIYNEFTFD